MKKYDKQNKIIRDLKDNCISLKKFLMCYYGVIDENIFNGKLSHKVVKELMPYVKRTSFEELTKNKEILYSGNIIGVVDSYGIVLPYINPKLEIDNNIEVEYSKEEKKEEVIKEIIISENLNLYELRNLCKYFRVNNKVREYRAVCKILHNKKDPKVKQYKKEKQVLIVKGRM